MKSILFYWGKGAETRVFMVKEIAACNAEKKPCFLNSLAQSLGITHVAVKKHLTLLIEDGYVKEENPGGKPVFLSLTAKGKSIAQEFSRPG